jgi:hypothetical protein
MAATIDTLRLAKRFKDARLTDEQAELLAEVLRETQEAGLAQLVGKVDLDQLRLTLRADLERTELMLRADLDKAAAALRAGLEKAKLALRRDLAALEARIAEAKFDLLKWVVPLLAAQLLAVVGLYFR